SVSASQCWKRKSVIMSLTVCCHTNPKRKRGFLTRRPNSCATLGAIASDGLRYSLRMRIPRLRFGLVSLWIILIVTNVQCRQFKALDIVEESIAAALGPPVLACCLDPALRIQFL